MGKKKKKKKLKKLCSQRPREEEQDDVHAEEAGEKRQAVEQGGFEGAPVAVPVGVNEVIEEPPTAAPAVIPTPVADVVVESHQEDTNQVIPMELESPAANSNVHAGEDLTLPLPDSMDIVKAEDTLHAVDSSVDVTAVGAVDAPSQNNNDAPPSSASLVRDSLLLNPLSEDADLVGAPAFNPLADFSADGLNSFEMMAHDTLSSGVAMGLSRSPVPVSHVLTAHEISQDPVFQFQIDDGVPRTVAEQDARLNEYRIALERRKNELSLALTGEKEKATDEKVRLLQEKHKLSKDLGSWGDPTVDETGVYILTVAQCSEVLRRLMGTQEAIYFNIPVNPIALGIPHYPNIIKHPMDFGTIKSRLESGHYNNDTDLFIADVRLVFRNCEMFNPPDIEATKFCHRLSTMFEEAIRDSSKIPLIGTEKPKPSKPSKATPSSRNPSLSGSRSALQVSSSSLGSRKKYDDDDVGSGGKDEEDSGFPFGQVALNHVRQFCDTLQKRPDLMKRKKLQFFKDFLMSFDFK